MGKNVKIEIRLDEDVKSKLQSIAVSKNMTVSKLIRQEIQKILNEEKGEENEKD